MKFHLICLTAILVSMTSSFAKAQVPKAIKTAEETIDPEKIRAHVRFLADDLMEGRGPGSEVANLQRSISPPSLP
jgi:hypothetical protein